MKQQVRKIERKIATNNIYSEFGFNRNPFPRKPSININSSDERENGSIYIPDLRREEINSFKKIIIPNSSNQEPKNISFLMDYATRQGRGIGKTSFLNYQSKFINKDLGYEITDGSDVIYAVYVSPIPGEIYKRFWMISKQIIKNSIDQKLLSIALCRLRFFHGEIDPRVLEHVNDENILETMGDTDWIKERYRDLGLNLNDFNLEQKIKHLLINEGINSTLADRLSRFGGSPNELSKYYFEPISDSDWKKNSNQILFDEISKILNLAGFTKCIFLLDEMEKIIQPLNSQDRRNFCDELRYWAIDGTSENCKNSFYNFLFVIHPYLQELLNPHWNASGLERFASLGGQFADDYTIYFKPIDQNQAIPLAIEYMNKSRIDKNQRESLKPFDKDSLELALVKSYKIPGKFLNFLHIGIERAIQDRWETIDSSKIDLLSLSFKDSFDGESAESNSSNINLTESKTDL